MKQLMKKKVLTLCIIHKPFGDDQDQHPKVLLGMKKRGFGAGRWNGFGGKVEQGESVEDAAKREILEEAGIKVANIEKMGEVGFEFKGDPMVLQVHIFKAGHFEGEPIESDEMKPRWFHIDEIPFDQMWPDDKYWLPLFLEGKKFKGKFVFEGQDKILEHELVEV